MPLDVEAIAELLRENAERFRSLANDAPLQARDIEEQAKKCEQFIHKLSLTSLAPREVRGPWLLCPQWLYPDYIQWDWQSDDQQDTSATDFPSDELRILLTEALGASFAGETNAGNDDSWQLTQEDALSARFVKPHFLPGVILAQLTKEIDKTALRRLGLLFFTSPTEGRAIRAEGTRQQALIPNLRSCIV